MHSPSHTCTVDDSLLDSGMSPWFQTKDGLERRRQLERNKSADANCSSVGFLTMMIPLYQAEICHPSIRGRVTALQQFMLGVGALCATWIGYGTYTGISPDNHAQWQVPLGIQIAPAVFLGLLISFFPEVNSARDVNRTPLTEIVASLAHRSQPC